MTKPSTKTTPPIPIIKNFLALYFLTLFGLVLGGWLLIDFSLNQKKQEVETELAQASDRIKKIVSYDIDYVKYQTFYASNQIAQMNGDKEKIHKLLANFLANFSGQLDVALTWNAFSWIDDKNKLAVDGTSGILMQAIDISQRDYLQETPKSPKTIIFGKPIYGALSHRFIVPAGLGTFSQNEKYLGTLVFGFDVEKIIAKLEKSVGNENISFAFYLNGEYIFSSQNFDEDYKELASKRVLDFVKNERIDGEVILTQKILSNKNVNAYYQKTKNYPFQFVVFYNKESYHKEILDILFKQIILIFIVFISCFILFRNIYKKIVKPVSGLSELANKISQNDFSYKIEEPKGKEMKELYDALSNLKEAYLREEELTKQLKIANKQIAQENFNKSEFLSAISHDIRNPLSAIISFTQMLQDNEVDNFEEILKEIENCSTDALEFINDLLDVTQASSGIFSVNLSQKIDANNIIKRSIRVNRDFANKKNIAIFNNCDEEIDEINLDPRRLKQILVNLINNSIKYSRQNTKIIVASESLIENGRKKLKIIIQDEGLGMSEDELEKSMKKFGLARENGAYEKIDSFGIGLSLVRQLVELQNGVIEIKSKPGFGTIATIIFSYK